MGKIKKIKARQLLDSRGTPTIEAEIHSEKFTARAIVPSGASTGTHEALELRDNGKQFNGKSVLKAVENVNKKIAPKLLGRNPSKQNELDELMIELDGTENKSVLGANAVLSVSMALCKLGALEEGMPLHMHLLKLSGKKKSFLPVPQMNVLNGGRHAGIDNDIQEHMIAPVKAKDFSTALRIGAEIYAALKEELKKEFGFQGVLLGDEGGFVPAIDNVRERLELMEKVTEEVGYSKEVFFALDSAASEFFKEGNYFIKEKEYLAGELIDFYKELVEEFPVYSLEDALSEDDWNGWKELTEKLGKKVQIVGDDLLVTNMKRIERAVKEKSCNALLLKINQIGTITESIKAGNFALKNDWGLIVSHRSGETEDSFIADLAVGINASQSKFGAPARSERNAKYNQLIRIEETNSEYAGRKMKI
ncbi:MAG: phosphopyruvate hydratase [archaeon]